MNSGWRGASALPLLLWLWLPHPCNAAAPDASPEIVAQALSGDHPTIPAPGELKLSDFGFEPIASVAGSRTAEPGITLELLPESLEWVRISDVLAIPRARVRIHAPGPSQGWAHYAGYTHPILRRKTSDAGSEVEFPVVLLSHPGNTIRVRVGNEKSAEKSGDSDVAFRIVYGPPAERESVIVDKNCAQLGLGAKRQSGLADNWAYVGCRKLTTRGENGSRVQSLELWVYWDGLENGLLISGREAPSVSPSTWALRLRGDRSAIRLDSPKGAILARYRFNERMRLGSFGAGIGPYSSIHNGPGIDVSTIAPLLTLYASYALGDTVRLVAFDATPIHSGLSTDLGLYLNNESFRVFDDRASLSLMIGGHLLWFRAKDRGNFRFGLPQGIEVIIRDFLKPVHNLGIGAFIYPDIDDKAYYNAWIRWGRGGYFGEVNYIGWLEALDGEPVYSRNFGLSFGMPLFQFL